MFNTLARRWIGFSLLALSPLSSVHFDGDRLEEYDFTGKIPIEKFVQQSRTHVLQYGLWTVQYYVELDPFKRNDWALRGNREEKVCVYFGTRPMWSSESTYKIGLSSLGSSNADASALKFVSLLDETERDIELQAVDCTGRDGITLLIRSWSRAINGGSSAELIRLSGTTPATAKVESLWQGGYEEFEDLDGDGVFEIIDTDRVHEWVPYLPHRGFWHKVVLEWDAEAERFAIRDLLALLEKLEGPRASGDSGVRKAWVEERFERVRKTVIVAREVRTEGSEDEAGDADDRALLTLASELTDLLWAGELEEARRLFGETSLYTYDNFFSKNEQYTSATWWEAFTAGCKRSRYWPLLCEKYPPLIDL